MCSTELPKVMVPPPVSDVLVYYGDNIPEQPTSSPTEDNWRVRLAMARLWRDAVNRHGGDVTLVHLPEIGIRGNSHMMMQDKNNAQIVEVIQSSPWSE